jgi:hypothetical protein
VSPADKSRMIVAIAVNIGVGQVVASWLGFPRWAGTVAAGGAMAAASMQDSLPPLARPVVQIAVLPGNLTAQLLEDNQATLGEPCKCDNNG